MGLLLKNLFHLFIAVLLLVPVIDARCGSSWRGRSRCCKKCTAPQVLTDCDPKCPSAHALEQECNGRRYKLFCGLHVATNPLNSSQPSYRVADYGECFRDCANNANCGAFDYNDGNCWLKTHGVDPAKKVMKEGENSVIFLDKAQ